MRALIVSAVMDADARSSILPHGGRGASAEVAPLSVLPEQVRVESEFCSEVSRSSS